MTVERIGTNSEHGYAWARPDGLRARCGGEALCAECRVDAELVTAGMDLIPGKREVRKTPGLLGLERFMDSGMEGARDGISTYEAMAVIEDLTEKAICDLGGTGREGMKLLVRVALAAREWAGVAPLAEMGRDASALAECVKALDEWERSL